MNMIVHKRSHSSRKFSSIMHGNITNQKITRITKKIKKNYVNPFSSLSHVTSGRKFKNKTENHMEMPDAPKD